MKLEAERSTINKQADEMRTREEEMEVHNQSLQTYLNTTIERQHDITPFHDQACLIQRNIHQVQLKIAEEIYKIKQAETRLKEISTLSIDFSLRMLNVVEKVQGQLIWVESNSSFPE